MHGVYTLGIDDHLPDSFAKLISKLIGELISNAYLVYRATKAPGYLAITVHASLIFTSDEDLRNRATIVIRRN